MRFLAAGCGASHYRAPERRNLKRGRTPYDIIDGKCMNTVILRAAGLWVTEWTRAFCEVVAIQRALATAPKSREP